MTHSIPLRPLAILALCATAACSTVQGPGIAPKYSIGKPAKVQKLPATKVTISSRSFDVRRERATYDNGKTEEIWEMNATGEWIKCFSPNQGGCERAYRIWLQGSRAGGESD